MARVEFAIVGGGWRAEFYLRAAHMLPERFGVCGMLVRDEAKGRAVEERWGVRTWRSLDELLGGCDPAFVVISVSASANAAVLHEVAGRGVPALAETPAATELDGLVSLHALTEQGAKVQVAEQYTFQPMHAARLAVIASGRLGAVSHAQVSAAHGYHGVSLLRHYLGVGFEGAEITACSFASPIVAGPGRGGPPTEERTGTSTQTLAWLRFGGKLGVYDFTGDQYFSWIRSPRVLVRGERGEINNRQVRSLADFRTPVEVELRRADAGHGGNLEGYHHKGVLAGDEWVYRNPFAPARLSDEEIAIATCLAKMADYVHGGPEFYSLAGASQDRYLDLLIAEAAKTGRTITSTPQVWAGL